MGQLDVHCLTWIDRTFTHPLLLERTHLLRGRVTSLPLNVRLIRYYWSCDLKNNLRIFRFKRSSKRPLLPDREAPERPEEEPCWGACFRGNPNMRGWRRNLRSDLKAPWWQRQIWDIHTSDLEVRLSTHPGDMFSANVSLISVTCNWCNNNKIRYLTNDDVHDPSIWLVNW